MGQEESLILIVGRINRGMSVNWKAREGAWIIVEQEKMLRAEEWHVIHALMALVGFSQLGGCEYDALFGEHIPFLSQEFGR